MCIFFVLSKKKKTVVTFLYKSLSKALNSVYTVLGRVKFLIKFLDIFNVSRSYAIFKFEIPIVNNYLF